MKNIKLLAPILLFLFLLSGCGMTGPLYRAPEAASVEVKKELPSEQQKVETPSIKATKSE